MDGSIIFNSGIYFDVLMIMRSNIINIISMMMIFIMNIISIMMMIVIRGGVYRTSDLRSSVGHLHKSLWQGLPAKQ